MDDESEQTKATPAQNRSAWADAPPAPAEPAVPAEAVEAVEAVEPGARPFWETKSLEQMSPAEWEALCDGCGKCCLVRLEDEATGDIYLTDVACRLFDARTCRCGDYKGRFEQVEDCLRLTPEVVRTTHWLPRTCAYRLLAEGKPLYDWHPLISGRPESVAEAGMSVVGQTISETRIKPKQWDRRRRKWPGEPRVLIGPGRRRG